MARLSMKEIARFMERLPPERIAAHQAEDKRAAEAVMRSWIAAGLVSPADVPALPDIITSLFAIVMLRDDFAEGTYNPAIRLISEALAARFARQAPEVEK